MKKKFSINLTCKSDQIYHLWYQIRGLQTCAWLILLTIWDNRYNYYWSGLISLVSTWAPAMPYFWALSIWTCWSSKNIWGFIALSIGPLGAPAKKCISSIINPHARNVCNNNNTTSDITQHIHTQHERNITSYSESLKGRQHHKSLLQIIALFTLISSHIVGLCI